MTDIMPDIRSGGATRSLSGTDPTRQRAPRVVVGGGHRLADRVADEFRDRGWVVHTAKTGPDAIRLALRKRVAAVLLPTVSGDESGYLTCAKLRLALPRVNVVLVGPARTPGAERFAKFVGAAFAAETDDPAVLARTVVG